jgi:hypothetical protein
MTTETFDHELVEAAARFGGLVADRQTLAVGRHTD